MTVKGFGIQIPSDYIAHPKDTDEMLHLKREVEGYERPDYASCKYLYTEIVNVKDIKLRKNVGRKRGNDRKVYDRVARSLEKGYKIRKLPPVILLNEDTNKLENWLVNGNHRWMWYVANNYEWMLVDVYAANDGYDEGDVIDEVGLLHQPQPEGTESQYDDYKARGKQWVRRQKAKGIDVTQEMVNEWVDTFAIHEIAIQRTNLKTYIFKDEVKDSFLINYTDRTGPNGIVGIYKKQGITILDSGATITTDIVDRLHEATQKVWIRDFLPTFLACAAEGIKTRLNFYVNTSKVSDGDELLKVISARIKELRGILDSLDIIYKDSEVDLRDFLIIGKRPFQIDGVDKPDQLQDITEELQSPNQMNAKMWQQTCAILQSNFPNGCFTATQALDAIRPIRTTTSKFKSDRSFRGTIFAELQILRNKGILHFVDNDGTYCFR